MTLRLPCGLICEYIPNSSDAVFIAVTIKSGAFTDLNQPGISHFLEHMLMEIDDEIYNRINFSMTGTTLFDHTNFLLSAALSENNFCEILEVARNIVFGEYLCALSLEEVRKQIIKEYELVNQNDKFIVESQFIKDAEISEYMPIGDKEIINKIQFTDLLKHYKKHYKLEKMQISIVGGDPEWKAVINNVFNRIGKIGDKSWKKTKNIVSDVDKLYTEKKHYSCIVFVEDITIKSNEKAYSDLVKSISLTILEEYIKEDLGTIQEDVFAEIIQYSMNHKFVRVKFPKYKSISEIFTNIYFKLNQPCTLHLFGTITYQYIIMLEKNFYGFQYINHLIDCFLYEGKPYKNSDLLFLLGKNRISCLFDDVILYLRALLKSKNYFYRTCEGLIT